MKSIVLFLIISILLFRFILLKPFIKYLESETSNPRGFIGKILTVMWSSYFKNLSSWGLSQVDMNKFHIILDVGFGGGYNIKYISERYPNVTIYGVDISEEARKTTEKLNQKFVNSGSVILSINDVSALNFNDHMFDFIIASQTHIFWNELEVGLIECLRVLKKDGTLLLLCELEKINYYLPKYNDHTRFSALLTKIGFKDVIVNLSGKYVAFISTK